MTKTHKPFYVLALLVLVIMLSAWQGGNVSSSTVNAIAFTNQAVIGVSANFQNIGQASHWLTYCPNANVTSISIELDASYDNVTYFAITPPGTAIGPGCSTLEGGGYFPYVHANLISIGGASAAVSAFYSGSSFPIPAGGIGQLGKSSVPTTFLSASAINVNIPGCTPSLVLTGPVVIYKIEVDNASNATVYVAAVDVGVGNTIARHTIATDQTYDILFPTVGAQVIGNLTVGACTTTRLTGGNPVGGGVGVTVYYKGNPIINSKSNVVGVVSGTTRGQ
jgi:hypothetical protein